MSSIGAVSSHRRAAFRDKYLGMATFGRNVFTRSRGQGYTPAVKLIERTPTTVIVVAAMLCFGLPGCGGSSKQSSGSEASIGAENAVLLREARREGRAARAALDQAKLCRASHRPNCVHTAKAQAREALKKVKSDLTSYRELKNDANESASGTSP